MTNKSCPWILFDDHEKENLDVIIDTTVAISSLLLVWLIPAYFYTNLKKNRSYYGIGRFLLCAWLRRCSPVIISTFILEKNGEFWRNYHLCEVSAMVDTFMAVYEIECLTLISAERCVVAKYYVKGWVVPEKYYIMFYHLGLFFAIAYSPGLVIGSSAFGPDFTCSTCTVDLVLPEGYLKYYLVTLLFMKSVKPTCLMILMLIACKKYERSYDDSANNKLQRRITKDVILMTFVSLLCWTPIALIRGLMVLSQLAYGSGVIFLPQAVYVKWALILHWNSMAPTALVLFMVDRNIRDATSKLRFRDIFKGSAEIKNE